MTPRGHPSAALVSRPGPRRPACRVPGRCATLWERRDEAAADPTLADSAGPAAGDWLSGRAPRSHRGGHWFDPSIAHRCKARSEAPLTALILLAGWELFPYWEEFGRSPSPTRACISGPDIGDEQVEPPIRWLERVVGGVPHPGEGYCRRLTGCGHLSPDGPAMTTPH